MNLQMPDGQCLLLHRPRIMGVLNVTPDSFSDGAVHAEPGGAFGHAMGMLDEGADLIDVGGESTRPGAARVDAEEQIRRTRIVIERISRAIAARRRPAFLSIDTTRAAVAAAALDAGASIINDVSAGRDDPAMLELAAARGGAIVLMHMQGTPKTMQDSPTYTDVVQEVEQFLCGRAEAAMAAGVQRNRILLDPGIGFGKSLEHNLHLLRNLHRLVRLGYPLVLGASRKRFMRTICDLGDDPESTRRSVGATCAATALGVAAGVHVFRVHDVAVNRQAAEVAFRWKGEGGEGKVSSVKGIKKEPGIRSQESECG